MMNCSEVSELVGSGFHEELSFAKNLELKIHFLICKHCRHYANKISALGAEAHRLLGTQEPTTAQMQHLEQQICEKICSGHD